MPVGSKVVEMLSAGLMVTERVLVVEDTLSVTLKVTEAVPVVVGVPEMVPVEALSDKPEGSEPEAIDHE